MEKEDDLAQQKVEPDTALKDLFINYVGEKFNPENGEVTVEMCVEVLANEFPDFLLLVAQENFLRGYSQCLKDMENTSENEPENSEIQ